LTFEVRHVDTGHGIARFNTAQEAINFMGRYDRDGQVPLEIFNVYENRPLVFMVGEHKNPKRINWKEGF